MSRRVCGPMKTRYLCLLFMNAMWVLIIVQNICFNAVRQYLTQQPTLFPLHTAAATVGFASIWCQYENICWIKLLHMNLFPVFYLCCSVQYCSITLIFDMENYIFTTDSEITNTCIVQCSERKVIVLLFLILWDKELVQMREHRFWSVLKLASTFYFPHTCKIHTISRYDHSGIFLW
jgi:hypothetical protein